MKKLTIILLALLPLFTLSVNADDNSTRQNIPIQRVTTTNGNRSISQTPIECCYIGMMNFIHTSVYTDLGNVYVEVINNNTGEIFWDSFDSGITPQHILTVSGISGYYQVTYITETGDIYEGSFIL